MKRKLIIILGGLAAIVTLLWPARGLAVPKDVVFYNDAVAGSDDLYSVVTVYDSPPETTTIEFYGRGAYLMMNDSAVLNLRGEGWFGRRNWDGFPPTESKLYDSSTVNVYERAGFGSGIEAFLDLYDSSTLSVNGGVVDAVCQARGMSTVNLYSGLFSLALWLYDHSTVNVYGGTIDTYLDNTSVPLTSTVNIYGYDFKYDPQGRWMPPMEPGGEGWWISKLTAYGFDGTPITYWGIPDPATQSNINLIPEPGTVVLLGLGAIVLFKKARRRELTSRVNVAAVVIGTILVVANTGWASRVYTHIITVGKEGGYDYETINAAIVAMNQKQPPLGEDVLGCIRVYPEIYIEQLNSNTGGNDLPAYCDLVGMGTNIDDVQIWHGGGGIYEAGVNCVGDNVVSHLKIYNYLMGANSQNGIYFHGDGTLENCIIHSVHGPAVTSDGHLIVTGSETDISTHFRSCINVKGTCEIYDCTLRPLTYTPVGQEPGGIEILSQPNVDIIGGIIDNVTITGNGTAKESYTILYGIRLDFFYKPDGVVYISNTTIDLTLSTEPWSAQKEFIVRGIGANFGFASVEDCTINISGIEAIGDPADPDDDGYAIKVEGIKIANGALEIVGSSSISTSRSVAGHAEQGHEYLLDNGCPQWCKGTLAVDFDTVVFDPNGENEPDTYDPNFVWEDENDISELRAFYIKNDLANHTAWFDDFGNLVIKGTFTKNTTPTQSENDEFRIQNSNGDDVAIIDMTNGDMYITGELHEECQTLEPSEESDDLIIKNKDGEVVAYVDESGNLYLKGNLYQNPNP